MMLREPPVAIGQEAVDVRPKLAALLRLRQAEEQTAPQEIPANAPGRRW
jgi:hypothetical protein